MKRPVVSSALLAALATVSISAAGAAGPVDASAAASPAGASSARLSLRAGVTVVAYGQPVTLSGRYASAGTVSLQSERFPFRHGFHTISAQRTSADGAYSFTARPARATRYRAILGGRQRGLRSQTVTVFVEARTLESACNLCGTQESPGKHTLIVRSVTQAPPGRLAAHGPVYFYYGLVHGTTPPAEIRLVKTVPLHRRRRELSYTVKYSVDFPAGAFEFRFAACYKDAEARDGLGLPGHYSCGDRTLTASEYSGYLG